MRGVMRTVTGGLMIGLVAGPGASAAEGQGAAFFGRLSCKTEKQLICDPNGCRILPRNEGAGAAVIEIDLPGEKVAYGTARTEILVKVVETTPVEAGKQVLARINFQAEGRPIAVTVTAGSPADPVREAVTTYPPKPGEGVGRYINVMACRPL